MSKISRAIKRLRFRRKLLLVVSMGLLSVTLVGTIIVLSEWKLARLAPGGLGESFPTKIYSAPTLITEQSSYDPQELIERLNRLDYRATAHGEDISAGRYQWNKPNLIVGLRGFKTPFTEEPPQAVLLIRTRDGFWKLQDAHKQPLNHVLLEPELAAELSGPKKIRRDPAAWHDFPSSLTDAVVAVEDRRFYKHHGIDFRAILRAAWHNVRHRRNLQGGSTITQQFVKNFFLTNDRTFTRKMLEAIFAVYLDLRFSKEHLFTLYLNHIYMGQDGVVSIAGMRAAAQFYFGKDVSHLTLSESALLAGIIRSPLRYNPFQNPESARNRRDLVLHEMLEEGFITEPELERAKQDPITTRKRPLTITDQSGDNDYFVSEVLRQLVPHISEDVLFRNGLKIHTTLDPVLQRKAQSLLKKEKQQAALIAIEPGSGRVLALVGGRSYRDSQFNRATQARRQPGSAFKPFVYGAALENGFTPASILKDEPRVFRSDKTIWAPKNFDGRYRGAIALRDALANSVNGATIDLAQQLGPKKIISYARRMGIQSPLEESLPLALGSSEVTLAELTAAYAPFANGGFRVDPLVVTAVLDAEDTVIETNMPRRIVAIDIALSYLMTSLLQTTVIEGTANSLANMGWTAPAAGKTGTTNTGKDAWFIGYTPELLTGVWVGSDQVQPLDLSGAKNALPVWARFMMEATRGRVAANFEKPTGIITVSIDPTSGQLARSGCPTRKDEVFVSGTQPIESCPLHAGGLRGWLLKIFR